MKKENTKNNNVVIKKAKVLKKKGSKHFFYYVFNIFKGFLMGLFDLVPGISGGTLALITGIYEKLIFEIRNVFDFVKSLFLFSRKKIVVSFKNVDFVFLFTLIVGVVSGLVVSAFVLSYLIDNFFVQTMGSIVGAILTASILLIKRNVKTFKHAFIGYVGLFFGIIVSILSPLSGHDFGFVPVFFLGAIAIIAMILPGVSGALILLLLGGYEFMISAFKGVLVSLFVFGDNHLIVLVFVLGALFGLGTFSRVISYLLKHRHDATMSFLSFLMLGAITKPVLEILYRDNSLGALPFFVVFFLVSFFLFRKS